MSPIGNLLNLSKIIDYLQAEKQIGKSLLLKWQYDSTKYHEKLQENFQNQTKELIKIN